MPPEAVERYSDVAESLRAEALRLATEGVAPIEVAKAVEHALTSARPKTRYLVGRDAKLRARLAKVLPDRVMDAAIGRALGQRKRV